MVTSSRVGVTSKARAAKGPAWDSSSTREAGVRSGRCISYARLSQAWVASRCQPLHGQRSRVTVLSGQGAGLADQSGASKPQSQRCCRARIAAVAQGRTPSPRSARSRRSAAAGARAWTTGRVLHQDALAVGAGAAQAEPTEPLRELGCPYCGGGQGGVKLEQAGEALCNGRIVVCCVGGCQVWGPYAQQVVGWGAAQDWSSSHAACRSSR